MLGLPPRPEGALSVMTTGLAESAHTVECNKKVPLFVSFRARTSEDLPIKAAYHQKGRSVFYQSQFTDLEYLYSALSTEQSKSNTPENQVHTPTHLTYKIDQKIQMR